MKYGYTVKKNGVLYHAGEEVPEKKERIKNEPMENGLEVAEKNSRRGRPPKTGE